MRILTYRRTAEKITVFDIYGNETEMTSNFGNYTIGIGNAPVYIKADSLKGLKIADESNTDYGLPYSNDIWKMILKDKREPNRNVIQRRRRIRKGGKRRKILFV